MKKRRAEKDSRGGEAEGKQAGRGLVGGTKEALPGPSTKHKEPATNQAKAKAKNQRTPLEEGHSVHTHTRTHVTIQARWLYSTSS